MIHLFHHDLGPAAFMNKRFEVPGDGEEHVLPHQRVGDGEVENVLPVQPLLDVFQVRPIDGLDPDPTLVVALVHEHQIEGLDAHHDPLEACYIQLTQRHNKEGTLHDVHYTTLRGLEVQTSTVPTAIEGQVP